MIPFQLDECASSRKLLSSCKKQKLCVPFAYPRRFKGKAIKDPQVLARVMANGRALVTTDLAIVDRHCECIPINNPGLIMLGPSPGSPHTTTEKLMMKMLSNFKTYFPDWHDVSWRNSIVRITESTVELGHVATSGYVYDYHSDLDKPGWVEEMKVFLENNV